MTPAWRIERAPSWLLTRAADACLRGSDYQTGGWDTDAAENIAYDVASARAFVASAETGVIKVVDMSNPTSITEVGTLNVGTQLSTQCMEVDCIYERMDFGGRHNPCGYAPVMKVVTNYGTLDVSAGVVTGAQGSWSMPSCARLGALDGQRARWARRRARGARQR